MIILSLLILLSGCGTDSLAFPDEDNIQPYVQKVLGFGEVPDFDYSPSIEDFFMTAFKAKLFENDIGYMESAMSEDGLLADANCTIYLPIGYLSSICDGKTRLYIDEKSVYEFNSEDKMGNSYSLLAAELAKKIWEYISNPLWFPDSIRGKKIYAHFYMTEKDWLNAVADKDPFKYLCLDVYIQNEK